MGLCVACCAERPHVEHVEDAAVRRKLRPLLLSLEREFQEHAGEDQMLDHAELTALWQKSARRQGGKLTGEEEKLIEDTARRLMAEMDTDGNGKVSYHEFAAHSLGGTEDRGALRSMRQKLNQEFARDPNKLKDIMEKFKAWDKNGDGFVTTFELEEHLAELAADVADDNVTMSRQDSLNNARQLKEELLAVADVDNDGKVDLWEIMAWAMGRRKQPVELILYDISKGATDYLGPLLLGRFDVEAFHSAVFVYGSEFWYGGRVFRSDPPCTKQFGEPLRQSPVLELEPSEVKPGLHVVRLGYTFVTHKEFLRFLQDKVVDRYTGIEKYDLLTHSCNHFSDEVLHFLLGRGVPAHVLELQNMAETPAVKSLRPFLNRHLGGFSGHPGGGDQLLEEEDTGITQPEPGDACARAVLGKGDVVVLDATAAGLDETGTTVVATLLCEDATEVCSVKYFDPASGAITVKTGVPTAAIRKRASA